MLAAYVATTLVSEDTIVNDEDLVSVNVSPSDPPSNPSYPRQSSSHDLGASPLQTFWRVIFPLSIPGVLAGATFAFVLSLGDFLAPLLLGGPSGIMISNIVVSLFGAAYNWPLGAAISFCMLALVLALLFLSESLEKKWSFR